MSKNDIFHLWMKIDDYRGVQSSIDNGSFFDKVREVDEYFSDIISNNYHIYTIATYIDFKNWVEDNGYDEYDVEEFDSFLDEWVMAAQKHRDRMLDWYKIYQSQHEEDVETTPPNTLIWNGKKYALVEVA